ncbi:MAG: Flp pilus assembly protein CpaB [Candidatus Rokubacteria bacterium]|nr:Flp pilus assembly protein CpaB [Candidatus Rokubacteria bacterium]
MTRRFIAILVFATAAGLLASVVVYRVVVNYQTAAADLEQNSEDVVVAALNMGFAEKIGPAHVRLMRWPKSAMPAGAVRRLADAQGRIVRTSLVAGEPLLEAKLAPEMAGRGGLMPMLVPEGQRAVTIKVDDAVKESGFILPNSHVDVVVSMARTPGAGERVAKLILQDVVVLAAGQTVEMRDNKPVSVTTVTLALTPEQTERLVLAQTDGRLTLTTRNLGDKQLVRTPGATPASLLADGAPAPVAAAPLRAVAAPPRAESYVVTVLRSGKPSQQMLVRDGAQDQWMDVDPHK